MDLESIADMPFGAIVRGVDCAALAADADAVGEIRQALHENELLVFPGQQQLLPRDEVAFCRAIDIDGSSVWRDQVDNPWEVYKVDQGNAAGTYQLPGEPGVLVLGQGEIDHHGLQVTLGGDRHAYGEDRGSQVLGGGALQWHIDGAFYEHPPCQVTQMRCIEAPASDGHWLDYDDGSGDRLWCAAGATAFASGRIAFDLLADGDRETCLRTRVHYASNPFQATYRLGNSGNGLRVIDPDAEARHARGDETPCNPSSDPLAQIYPLVWTCPTTGRRALMPHPRCLFALETESGGRLLGITESRLRVEAWMRPAIDPARVYVHAWRPGDLVLWYNHSIWHSATGKLAPDDRRIMHLTAFNGAEPPQVFGTTSSLNRPVSNK